MLNSNLFYPIDGCVIYIGSIYEDFVRGFLSWEDSVFSSLGLKIERRAISSKGMGALKNLLPLTSHQIRRTLIVPTKSNWIALFNNSINGTDASSVPFLSRKFKTRCIVVKVVPEIITDGDININHPHGGTCYFEIYDHDSQNFNNCTRYIHVCNEDGRWSFDQGGSPLPFEQLNKYKSKKIKDRLTPSMICDYLGNLGIDSGNENFYDWENSTIIEKHGPGPSNMRECWSLPKLPF